MDYFELDIKVLHKQLFFNYFISDFHICILEYLLL